MRQLSNQMFHNHKYLDSGDYVKGMHNIAPVYCTLVKSNIPYVKYIYFILSVVQVY